MKLEIYCEFCLNYNVNVYNVTREGASEEGELIDTVLRVLANEVDMEIRRPQED